MTNRGLGQVYQPTYTNKKTGVLKTSTIWWLVYYVRGTRYRECAHSTRRADAVRLLKQRLGDIGAGRPVGPALTKTTFEDLAQMLLDDYRANQRRLPRAVSAIAHLRAAFGLSRALDITADRITAYAARRQAAKAKPATVNRELSALKRMFRLGQRAGKVGERPYIAMLQEDNVRTGFFEAEQWAAVAPHLPADLRPVFETAYLTGWRVKSELLTRHRHHVDLAAGWLRLEPGETKNKKGRMFPPRLRAVLEAQLAHTRAVETATGTVVPWLFHRQGKPIKSFRRAWRTACQTAGLAGRIPHDFRRTAVRNLERAGVPRSTAMAMVGHQTEAIYRRYAIADERMLRDGATKLEALHDQDAPAPIVIPFEAARRTRARSR
jgi:integrase